MTQHIGRFQSHVVVGADGSDSATEAVVWAAHEAALRRLPLRVVHGLVWPQVYAPIGGAVHKGSGDGLWEGAEQILTDAAGSAHAAQPDIEVDTSLIEDTGPVALLESGRDAALLVVGSRGPGGFSGLVVGSTAVQLARHVLVEASAEAQLLVVGARGVGGFRGLLFGSVSQAMLHHSHCPVAVVRPQPS
ncbi:MAG: universal stress protein [Micromonosporaceae bacterium]